MGVGDVYGIMVGWLVALSTADRQDRKDRQTQVLPSAMGLLDGRARFSVYGSARRSCKILPSVE